MEHQLLETLLDQHTIDQEGALVLKAPVLSGFYSTLFFSFLLLDSQPQQTKHMRSLNQTRAVCRILSRFK